MERHFIKVSNTIFSILIIFFFIQNCFSQESWTPTSMVNVPTARYEHTAVWTGSVLGGKMIVWGGDTSSVMIGFGTNTGGIYDPMTDSWQPTQL